MVYNDGMHRLFLMLVLLSWAPQGLATPALEYCSGSRTEYSTFRGQIQWPAQYLALAPITT